MIFLSILSKCELHILANVQTQQNIYSHTQQPPRDLSYDVRIQDVLQASSHSLWFREHEIDRRRVWDLTAVLFLALVEVELMTLLLPHGKRKNTSLVDSSQHPIKCYKEQSAMFHKACRTFNAHHNNLNR